MDHVPTLRGGRRLGRLERGLDEAGARGWIVVDMKQEWKSVWPPSRVGR